jgi:hypothetical protein
MTRPPSEAVDLTHLISHLQEHLFDVENAKRLLPWSLKCSKRGHLPAGDLIALDAVLFGEVGARVFYEAARDLGRQFDRFAGHRPNLGAVPRITNSGSRFQVGGRNSGDLAHSSRWALVSACRAFLSIASRSGPGAS